MSFIIAVSGVVRTGEDGEADTSTSSGSGGGDQLLGLAQPV